MIVKIVAPDGWLLALPAAVAVAVLLFRASRGGDGAAGALLDPAAGAQATRPTGHGGAPGRHAAHAAARRAGARAGADRWADAAARLERQRLIAAHCRCRGRDRRQDEEAASSLEGAATEPFC